MRHQPIIFWNILSQSNRTVQWRAPMRLQARWQRPPHPRWELLTPSLQCHLRVDYGLWQTDWWTTLTSSWMWSRPALRSLPKNKPAKQSAAGTHSVYVSDALDLGVHLVYNKKHVALIELNENEPDGIVRISKRVVGYKF